MTAELSLSRDAPGARRRLGGVLLLSLAGLAHAGLGTVDHVANRAPVDAASTAPSTAMADRFAGLVGCTPHEAGGNFALDEDEHDPFGWLPQGVVDTLIRSVDVTRDARGRPVRICLADGSITQLRYAETPSGPMLSALIDKNGSIEFTRDAQGRLIKSRSVLPNGLVRETRYGFANDVDHAHIAGATERSTVRYPDGGRLHLVTDASGRVKRMEWNDEPIVDDIQWNADGEPERWRWAFAQVPLNARREHDAAGRLVATEFSRYTRDKAGRIDGITQTLFRPLDDDPSRLGTDAVEQAWHFTPEGASERIMRFVRSQAGAAHRVVLDLQPDGDKSGDGIRRFGDRIEGRMGGIATGDRGIVPATETRYDALGRRVLETVRRAKPSSTDDDEKPAASGGMLARIGSFFGKLWHTIKARTVDDVELERGFASAYDEDGSLLSETPFVTHQRGGTTLGASGTQLIYLPTAHGPMPIVAIIDGRMHAVHTDHLDAPRRLTDGSGQAVWQWAYADIPGAADLAAKARDGITASALSGTSRSSSARARPPG